MKFIRQRYYVEEWHVEAKYTLSYILCFVSFRCLVWEQRCKHGGITFRTHFILSSNPLSAICLKYKLVYLLLPRPKGCWVSQFSGYQNAICDVYRSVPNNLVERTNHFIIRLICYPVLPAALYVCISSLVPLHHVCIIQKHCQNMYVTLPMITVCVLKFAL